MRSSPLAQLAPSSFNASCRSADHSGFGAALQIAEHSAEAPANAEPDDEQCADVQSRELRRIVLLSRSRLGRILDLEQPQMLEARLDPRKLVELPALEDLGIAGGERRATRVDRIEGLTGVVEQRDEDGVGTAGLRQGLQARGHALAGGLDREALKVDGDFRTGELEAGARPRFGARLCGRSPDGPHLPLAKRRVLLQPGHSFNGATS